MRTEKAREWACKALTSIWTGDADHRGGRLISTGLLGSIRCWFEVLVRGLGGSACDPIKSTCEGPDHCVACEGDR
jgi:CRISPR-associated protein Cmr1